MLKQGFTCSFRMIDSCHSFIVYWGKKQYVRKESQEGIILPKEEKNFCVIQLHSFSWLINSGCSMAPLMGFFRLHIHTRVEAEPRCPFVTTLHGCDPEMTVVLSLWVTQSPQSQQRVHMFLERSPEISLNRHDVMYRQLNVSHLMKGQSRNCHLLET